MSTKVLLINEWLELKKLEVLKNKLLEASEKLGTTSSISNHHSAWIIKKSIWFFG